MGVFLFFNYCFLFLEKTWGVLLQIAHVSKDLNPFHFVVKLRVYKRGPISSISAFPPKPIHVNVITQCNVYANINQIYSQREKISKRNRSFLVL